ncbi:hypothetical protein niasHT_037649 [Heterodera trifolii]|uniref:Uncharacterized protein n=1 Tax=Heterodera trifolii TaxID=157864 RepID=A0ABD2ILJ1_9BILA
MSILNPIIILILLFAACSKTFGSSQEPSQEVASAEFNSNEIKPISERKVLPPPSPAYNKNDIEKIEEDLHNEYDGQINPNTWYSNVEQRMDLPFVEIDERGVERHYSRAVVDEWGLRRAFRNERRKNGAKHEMVDKKHEKLALRNAAKNNEIAQYAKAVDGKVDTLYADHEATRKLAKATRGGVGALKSAMKKHNGDMDERFKRHSGEIKLHGNRLATIEESVNEKHQETTDNMDTLVKQLGKNVIHENDSRHKIGKVLENHGQHLDKNRKKLKNMKARTKHLYDSVEVQGGALDHLGTNFGDINDEVKALKEIVALQSVALKKLQSSQGQDDDTVKKMIENQKTLTKSVMESNKQVLQLLGDFAHQLGAKVSTAIDSVDLQLAKALSISDEQPKQQQQQQQQEQPPAAKTTNAEASVAEPIQQKKVASLAERVQHPLFLKKRDPKREQYEKEQQQKQHEQASQAGAKPAKVEEKLGRPYAEEFSKPSPKKTTTSSSSSTTDESNITFESALKALGLKKNGKKLMAHTHTSESAAEQQAPAAEASSSVTNW